MTSSLSRRSFCRCLTGGLALSALSSLSSATVVSSAQRKAVTLSIGNYGMQSAKIEEAIRLIAELGFDGIELTVMPQWDSAPEKLSTERRVAIRQMLTDSGLALTSLMEYLIPSPIDAERRKLLDRLKRAADLGHALSPVDPPLVQTVLGAGNWTETKDLYVDCLGDWLDVAESTQTVVGIKPHRGGAMSEPVQAVWLLEKLKESPWIGMVYDYSHYALRNLSIAETVSIAYPKTVHVVVKDAVKKGGQVEFALPGEAGTIDHGEILTRFYDLGYRKDVCCEVSRQVSNRPGYDAAAAAKTCYQNMSLVFDKANISRRRRLPESEKES